MPYFNVSWANMARLSNGEELYAVDGELVTASGRFAKQQDTSQASAPGALVVSTPSFAKSYSTRDIAALGRGPHCFQKPWNGPFRFLDLDWNGRRAIIEVLIGNPTVAVFLPGRYGQSAVGIKLPEITKVNKQLRTESLFVAIAQTTFEIHSGPGNTKFQNWLGMVDLKPLDGDVADNIKTGYDAVQKLRFPFFSRFPHALPHITSNNDINFMAKCDNLQEVGLNFHVQEVIRQDTGVEKSAEQLVKEYYLDGILGVPKLKKLQFLGWCSSNEELGIIALGKWFAEQFKGQQEKGQRKGRVEVIWPGKPPVKED